MRDDRVCALGSGRTAKNRSSWLLAKKLFLCPLIGMGGAAGSAYADEFVLEDGTVGRWALNMSYGTSVRTTNPDQNLIMKGNGGAAGAGHDDGELNYAKHDAFSKQAKAIGEISLKKGNYGVFVRAKAWRDFELEDDGVPFGSSANRYTPGAKLNDSGFDKLSKFSGVELLDAYVYARGDLGDNRPVTVKVGNQVLNWGESLFIPGINQFGAFDVSAARRPGAQIKEILLPIPQVTVNLGLADGVSVEGFYQTSWRKNIVDGCGTYWSVSDIYNCSSKGVNVPAGPLSNLPDQTSFGSGAGFMANAGDVKPTDSGQWGLALRYFVPDISTEFGVYFANYHQRSSSVSIKFDGNPAPSAFSAGNSRMKYAWDWSAENIKVLGISFSTSLAGWSVSGELSHTKDFPVQINGLDLLRGTSVGAGPMGFLRTTPRDVGILFHGYDRKDKNQVQVSTLKLFPQVLGAESAMLIGEIAAQHWSKIDDPYTSRRYGRGFLFGQAVTSTLTNCAAGGAAGAGNARSDYCENKGFATPSAWGYRLQVELSYPDVLAGINLKPRVFWSADVKGYSGDLTFLEDRRTLVLAGRFDYLGKYYADISYNRFNHNAKYDIFHDRDFYSVVVGVNF